MMCLIQAAPNHPSLSLQCFNPACYQLLYFAIITFSGLSPLFPLAPLPTNNKLLPSKYILGAIELTTQLSKLINILWLPLWGIYKLGSLTREDCCDPLHLWVIG